MRVVAVDSETELIEGLGQKVRTVHFPPRFVCLSVAGDGFAPGGAVFTSDAAGEVLHELAADPDVLWVFHNSKFDVAVFCREWPGLRPALEKAIREGRVTCTRVLHALRYVLRDGPRTLAHLAYTLCGLQLDKGATRLSFRAGEPLTAEQEKYAKQDAVATLAVFQALAGAPLGSLNPRRYEHVVAARADCGLPAHPHEKLTPTDRLFCSASASLAFHLETTGVRVDRGALASHRAEAEEIVDRLSAQLGAVGLASRVRDKDVVGIAECCRPDWKAADHGRAWAWDDEVGGFVRRVGTKKKGYYLEYQPAAGWKLNTRALREAHEQVAETHNLDIPHSEKTGEISLKYDEWKLHRALLPEALEVHLDLSKARKTLTAFLYPLTAADADRVFPSYLIPGAETKRWSCARPNLQQLPKKLRSLYLAEEGECFVYADYPTLELYTLAHCMQALGIEGELMKVLRSGKDIHIATAAMIAGVPEAHIVGDERQKAKALNFGMPGGLGSKRLHAMGLQQYGLTWTEPEAAELRLRWLMVYTDVLLFLEKFRIDVYGFCPPNKELATWFKVDLGRAQPPTRWDLSRELQDGQLYTTVLPSGGVMPRRRYTQAANSFFQATGAEVCTRAFLNCQERGLNVAAVVHDSITARVSRGGCRIDTGQALALAMQDALRTVCPSVPIPAIEYEVSNTLI